jgi:hypothetical protein
MLWERMVQHTIRPDFKDGFVLPYAAALRLAQEDADFDPEIVVARVPSDRLGEFSYATEHVTHDGAVGALLACTRALERAKEHLEGPWGRCLRWINDRLGEVWTMRGPYPGLGSALCAFGLDRGVFLARRIEAGRRENEDPWPAVEKMFRDPQSMLPKELSGEIPAPLRAAWKQVQQTDRLALLRLLARFEITPDQARVLYEPSERSGAGIDCTDDDILTDPYRSPSLHSPPEKSFANPRCAHLWRSRRIGDGSRKADGVLCPEGPGLAGRAEDYPWSSAAAHLGMGADPLVRRPERLLAYVPDFAELLRLPQDREALDLIRRHEWTGRPLGDEVSLERLERRLHRGLAPGKAGRKPKDGWK